MFSNSQSEEGRSGVGQEGCSTPWRSRGQEKVSTNAEKQPRNGPEAQKLPGAKAPAAGWKRAVEKIADHPESSSRPLNIKVRTASQSSNWKITQQGFQILEKFAACAQSLTNRAVLLIHQV